MDLLLAERIDHGIRAIEDRDLVAELARRQMPLDICPHSNLQTGLFSTLSEHPINRLRLAGVPVSLNTDDPVVFEVDLWGEYWRAAEAFSWTHRELREIARTSVQSSFAPEAVKQRLLAEQAGLPDPL